MPKIIRMSVKGMEDRVKKMNKRGDYYVDKIMGEMPLEDGELVGYYVKWEGYEYV
jgi:hypothetical protein